VTRPAKKHSRRRVLEVAAGAVVIALVFAYFLPKIADYSQVWAIVSTLSWPWILALVAASALFILSDAPPWLAVLPGLRFFDALRMDLAGSALSQVIPGGAAVNVATQYGMLKNWGF
jgi:putative heme transporter